MLAITAIIVGVWIHWFDVVARLQDAHRRDPVLALLNDIPSLPRSSLLVDHPIQESIAPR